MRRRQQRLNVSPARVQIVTRQQPNQLRRGPMLRRQQIWAARNRLQKVDRIVAQLGVLLEVLKVLGAPVPANRQIQPRTNNQQRSPSIESSKSCTTLPHHIQDTHGGRRADHRFVAAQRLWRFVTRIARRRGGDGERRGGRRRAAPVRVSG